MIENTYQKLDVISEIRRTLQIFKPEPSLIEIRSPKGVGGCKSGYFTNHDKLIQQIQTFKDFDSFTWYFVLNDINQDCYNLEQRDTIKKYMPKTTADDHITNREWLLIDCDPKRMSDIPSTDEEKAHAWNTLNRIYDFLQSRGFYEPVVCDSGNGYHLLYRIDMPNTKDNTEILKNFLKVLDFYFTDEYVQFDVSVFNASRITKLYGSWARKGSNTPDRPHRQSYIIRSPETIAITDISLIQVIADMLPKPEEHKSNYKGGTNTFDVRDFMIQHGIAIQKEVTGKDYTKFVLETCPFNPEHGADSAVFLYNNGQSGFFCFHNGCSGKGWKEFRTHFDPDAYEKKTRRVTAKEVITTVNPETQAETVDTDVTDWSAKLTANDLISRDTLEKMYAVTDSVERKQLEALLEIRAKELKISPQYKNVRKAFIMDKVKHHEFREGNVTDFISTETTNLYQRDYIYADENGRTKINVALLAHYFANNFKYLLVQGTETGEANFYLYRNGVYRFTTSNEIKGLLKSLIPLQIQKKTVLDEAYGLLSAEYDNFTDIEALNTDENVINFKNGLLYLDTMELKEHTPDILSTIQIDCNYNPNAVPSKDKHFDKYMEYFTDGDTNKRKFLLQYMGMAISNVHGYRTKKALFMVGDGDTGKTQLKELCVLLLGHKYTSGVDLQSLEERFGLANLFNKRLVGSNDMGYVSVKELRQFKQLTGGDSVNVEFKGKDPFNYIFKGVLWFCCNELPRFGGDKGSWVYSRIIPLTCSHVVPENMRDPKLLDKLYSEREYIIKLCVDGLREVIAQNYKYSLPEEVNRTLARYQIDNDTVLKFIEECCKKKDYLTPYKTSQYDVYKAYRKWSEENNNGLAERKDVFSNSLKKQNLSETVLRDGYVCYKDFDLTDEACTRYLRSYT